MVCTCCGCKDCSDIVGGAILYIDSNYEMKLNPSITDGTPMSAITPVIGPVYSVGPGCAPATFSKTHPCSTGYQFSRLLHTGYIGETIISDPAQQLNILAHADGQDASVGGIGMLFYSGGTGQMEQYTDYGNPTHPVRNNINWGATYVDAQMPGNTITSKTTWVYDGRTVHSLKFLVNPPPPPLGQTKQMLKVSEGSPALILDTGTEGGMGNPVMMGMTANVINGPTTYNGYGYVYCNKYTIQVGKCKGDYLPIGYNQSCLGFCDGAMATTVNATNEAAFQAGYPYTYGSWLHARLRRFAIFPTLLTQAEICSVLLCWHQASPDG